MRVVVLWGGANGTPVSELEVGDAIYLQENGVRTEFTIINKGLPSNSTLYDSSCNGLWIVRKDILKSITHTNTSTDKNDYATSGFPSALESYVASAFDTETKNFIKQVKVPYAVYNKGNRDVFSGASGLSCTAFLLCFDEIMGEHYNSSYCPPLGGWTEYYIYDTDGDNSVYAAAKAKRVKYLDGVAAMWYTRSPSYDYNSNGIYAVDGNGVCSYAFPSAGTTTVNICPAMVLDFSATVDEDNNLITG